MENRQAIHFFLLSAVILMLFPADMVYARREAGELPRIIEVFATTGLPVVGDVFSIQSLGTEKVVLQIYKLDGIERIEAQLSKDLMADPEQSKRVVLQRFQQLQEEDLTRMQRAVMGLAKTLQYGIDRYPVIVFDGQAVVYGVTDVRAALAYYRTWRREGKR